MIKNFSHFAFRLYRKRMWDIYRRAGLKHNPFVAENEPGVEERFWLERIFFSPIANSGQLVQIVGDKGLGKTSLLLRWQKQMGGNYYYVAPNLSRWQLPPTKPLAYWDEADRIPRALLLFSLFRAFHKKYTIVAGTHIDLSCFCNKIKMPCQTFFLQQPTLEEIIHWGNLRIAASQLSPANPSLALKLDADTAQNILQLSKNWRDVGKELHKWAAEKASIFDWKDKGSH